MESELLKTFDEDGNKIGVASREEVHSKGYWHKTFHCWFISKENDKVFIYFQKRSNLKKDYPNLLDITAAGHLLADESVNDGVREVKEEIGINVRMEELISLGVIKYSVEKGTMLDKELANVYLYNSKETLMEFELQLEEVSGIVKAEFESFSEFWLEGKGKLRVIGFEINHTGERISVDKYVSKKDFVNHDNGYYESIIKLIRKELLKA